MLHSPYLWLAKFSINGDLALECESVNCIRYTLVNLIAIIQFVP